MTTSRIEVFEVEGAIARGECALGSFVLALCNAKVLSQLDHVFEEKHALIWKFSRVLNAPPNWRSVKLAILELRKTDKVRLQVLLAPVMRELAIRLAEGDPENLERTKQPLLSAFGDFINRHYHPASIGVGDDIFERHDFIQKKFSELIENRTDLVEAPEELLAWWGWGQPSGYQQFLNAMKKEGEWAGDLELFQLARFFQVNLDVMQNHFTHHIYIHNGKIPKVALTADQIAQLEEREVIERVGKDDFCALLPLDSNQLHQRLNAVPEYERVMDFILRTPALKGTKVPAVWIAYLEQLKIRNVITCKETDYVFSLDQNKAMERIAEISYKKDVLALWHKYYMPSPVLTLTHSGYGHWDNMVTVALPAQPIRSKQRAVSNQYAQGLAMFFVLGYCWNTFQRVRKISVQNSQLLFLPSIPPTRMLAANTFNVPYLRLFPNRPPMISPNSSHRPLKMVQQSLCTIL